MRGWLEPGYASYLSSWALMNTGRPDTNYGYWFPGPENDGRFEILSSPTPAGCGIITSGSEVTP